MSSDRDTTRIVRSWLDEGVTALPDRVLDAVLDQVPATPQRRATWGPARRFADMNTFAKFAVSAAAVVLAALVGINLLPGGGVGGDPFPSSTSSLAASPTRSSTPSLRPEPSPIADAFPAAGQLAVGRHTVSQNGIQFSFEVSTTGWQSSGIAVAPDGGNIKKAGGGLQEIWMLFWSIDGVFADPCGHVAAPPVSPSASDLAAAVASMPGYDVVTPPTQVTIGGQEATHVVVKLREDIDCSPTQFFMWYDDVRCGSDDPCHRWADARGQTNSVWIFERDGTHVWIEAQTRETASPETILEVQQVIDSIQFD
jgi:hypothetical protein